MKYLDQGFQKLQHEQDRQINTDRRRIDETKCITAVTFAGGYNTNMQICRAPYATARRCMPVGFAGISLA